MKLFLLFKVGIVLGHTLQGQFVGQSDVGGLGHVLFLEILNFNWVSCAEKADLGFRHQADNPLNNFREVDGQKFVYFIKDKHLAGVKIGYISAGEVEQAAWRCDQDVHSLVETVKVLSEVIAAHDNNTLKLFVFAQVFYHQGCLHGEFTRWHQHKSLNFVDVGVHLLDQWDAVSCGLSSTVLGFSDDIFASQNRRDSFFLDRGRYLITHFINALHEL